MTIADIQRWINDSDREYETGRLFYEEVGSSRYLKNLFSSGEDGYNSIRLLTELKLIVKNSPHLLINSGPDKSAAAPAAPAAPVTPGNEQDLSSENSYRQFSQKRVPDINTADLPEDLQLLVMEKGSLYKQACSQHSRLELLPDDNARMKAVNIITSNFKRIDEIWRELDYWNQHKMRRPKDGMDLTKLSMVKLIARKNTIRTYISKLKNKPDDKAYLRYCDELDHINRILQEREDDAE